MRPLLVCLLCLCLACASYYSGPKAPDPPEDMVEVGAPEAVTWHTSIQVLARNDLPIEDLRRQFGWIETQVRPIDPSQATGWAECADPLQNAIAGPDRVAVLVRVTEDGSEHSKIHVQAAWSYSLDSEVNCQSNGIWERGMLAKIKDAAEAQAGEPDGS